MAEKQGFNWLLLIPAVVVACLGVLAALAMKRENPDELPSALIAQTAPAIALPALTEAIPAPTDDLLTKPGVKLVNFWASWCGPCRLEHPLLMEMQANGIDIIGVNYKDSQTNGLAFLAELGNPYSTVGADTTGRKGIDWGIYGVPETFVIDGDGKVLLRHPGPITESIFEKRFAPLLEGS